MAGEASGEGNSSGSNPFCNSRARSRSRCSAARSSAAACARTRPTAAATKPAKYSVSRSSSGVKTGRPTGLRNSMTPRHSSPSRSGAARRALVIQPDFLSASLNTRGSFGASSTRMTRISFIAAPTMPRPAGTRSWPSFGAPSPCAVCMTRSPVSSSVIKIEHASTRIHGRLLVRILAKSPSRSVSRVISPARERRAA